MVSRAHVLSSFLDAACFDTTTPGVFRRLDNRAFKRLMLRQAREAGVFGGVNDPDACAPKQGRTRGWVVAHQGLDVGTFVRLVLAESDKTMKVTMYLTTAADADADADADAGADADAEAEAPATARKRGKKRSAAASAAAAASAEARGWVNVSLDGIKSTPQFYKTVAWLVLTMELTLNLDASKCAEFTKVLAATRDAVANAKTSISAAAALKKSSAKILLEKTNKRNAIEEAAKAAQAVRRAYKSSARDVMLPSKKRFVGAGTAAEDGDEDEQEDDAADSDKSDADEDEVDAGEGGIDADDDDENVDADADANNTEAEAEAEDADDSADDVEDLTMLKKPELLKVLKRTRLELDDTLAKLVDMTKVVSLMRERRRVDDERQRRLAAIEARKYPMQQKSKKLMRQDLMTVMHGEAPAYLDSDSDADADDDHAGAGAGAGAVTAEEEYD